jgi:hypothetical protein
VLHSPALGDHGPKWSNDHNSPALIQTGKERIMAFWSLHGHENCFYTQEFDANMNLDGFELKRVQPSDRSRITYSNPIYLSKEQRLYNFFRGLDNSWKPSWTSSDDLGRTFSKRHILIDSSLPGRTRPYVKYVSDGEGTIHFFFTDDHPRSASNNVYHMVYRSGEGLFRSDGVAIGPLEAGIRNPQEATSVFKSGVNRTAWVIDAKQYQNGSLHLLFQVRDTRLDPNRPDPCPISYHIARFEGGEWTVQFVALAGPALYPKEEDYVGLGCLHPTTPNSLVISTKVNPRNGRRLKSWTLYAGAIPCKAESSWEQITSGSRDDLRPQCVLGSEDSVHIFWLKGKYESYTSYNLRISSQDWPKEKHHTSPKTRFLRMLLKLFRVS